MVGWCTISVVCVLLIKYITVNKIIKYTGGILSRRILLDVMVMKW